jgi:hypothetical protein
VIWTDLLLAVAVGVCTGLAVYVTSRLCVALGLGWGDAEQVLLRLRVLLGGGALLAAIMIVTAETWGRPVSVGQLTLRVALLGPLLLFSGGLVLNLVADQRTEPDETKLARNIGLGIGGLVGSAAVSGVLVYHLGAN